MNTTEQLKEYADKSAVTISQENRDIMNAFQQNLEARDFFSKMKGKGDKFPTFRLKNHHGEWVSSDEILKEGPMVVTFYRGGWCPYCNIELRGYQQHISEIEEKGVSLVAISPELPDTSMELVFKYNLDFHVLSDTNNELARELGLVFKLNPEIISVYKSFGIDVEKSQGNTNFELPIPATYIIAADGTITFCEAFVDYRKRVDPQEIINKL